MRDRGDRGIMRLLGRDPIRLDGTSSAGGVARISERPRDSVRRARRARDSGEDGARSGSPFREPSGRPPELLRNEVIEGRSVSEVRERRERDPLAQYRRYIGPEATVHPVILPPWAFSRA